jgi:hypothetical protein
MFVRKSTLFLIYIGSLLAIVGLLCGHAFFRQWADLSSLQRKSEAVKRLELTDLSLFTDARYTRHPSMADLNTPFQDYPMAFDYFPSGSLMTAPPHLKGK